MTAKINNIIKVVAAILIAVIVSSCEVNESALIDREETIYPRYDLIGTPKKTITIKRKKPTITNPSPRPLSASYETEEEVYSDYEDYE